MLKDAEVAASRAQLNEANWRKRRASLQALCDQEALESIQHLVEMYNDTADKFAAYNARLHQEQERLRELHGNQTETYRRHE